MTETAGTESTESAESVAFSLDNLIESIPEPRRSRFQRNHERRMRVYRIAAEINTTFPWMMWGPFRLAQTFWTNLIDEGLKDTLAPRWGLVTFSYLNDGMHPTLWHTLQQFFHHDGPYSGIWIDGAPKSKREAQQRLAKYRTGEGEATHHNAERLVGLSLSGGG